MQTTVIIIAGVAHGAQTFAPGVQVDVSDAVARHWVESGAALYAGSPDIAPSEPAQPALTPVKPRAKKKG